MSSQNQLTRFKKSTRANSRSSSNRYSKSRKRMVMQIFEGGAGLSGGGGVLDTPVELCMIIFVTVLCMTEKF